MNTLNERLAEAMSATGKTDRAKLARALGISVQAIGAVINGKSKSLSAENCSRAARYLGVNTDWLAAGFGKMLLNSNEEPVQMSDWPFEAIDLDAWEKIPDRVKGKIELYAEMQIAEAMRVLEESQRKIAA